MNIRKTLRAILASAVIAVAAGNAYAENTASDSGIAAEQKNIADDTASSPVVHAFMQALHNAIQDLIKTGSLKGNNVSAVAQVFSSINADCKITAAGNTGYVNPNTGQWQQAWIPMTVRIAPVQEMALRSPALDGYYQKGKFNYLVLEVKTSQSSGDYVVTDMKDTSDKNGVILSLAPMKVSGQFPQLYSSDNGAVDGSGMNSVTITTSGFSPTSIMQQYKNIKFQGDNGGWMNYPNCAASMFIQEILNMPARAALVSEGELDE